MGGGSTDAMFWFGIVALFTLVVGGSGVVFWLRRKAKNPDDGSSHDFTLEDLRSMLDRKEITKREFETARDAMIQRTRQTAQKERDRQGGTDWGGRPN